MYKNFFLLLALMLFTGCAERGYELTSHAQTHTATAESSIDIDASSKKPKKILKAGEVGYIIAGIKSTSDTRCGDTITLNEDPCKTSLEGFKDIKPVVFSSIYPISSDSYQDLHT